MESGFSFGIDLNINKKNQGNKLDTIVVSGNHTYQSKTHILLLLEMYPVNVSRFKKFIDKWFELNLPKLDYDVVSSTSIKTTLAEIKKRAIYKYYQENSSDYSKYIHENTIVISSGYALQSIIKSSDLTVDCFYDYIFNKTYFYAPQISRYVFPIDSFGILAKFERDAYLPVDCARSEFAKLQCKYIIEHSKELRSPEPPTRYMIIQVKSREDWLAMLQVGSGYKKIAFDIETSGLSEWKNHIGCVTVSYDGKTGYYIPIEHFNVQEFDEMLVGKYQIGANKKFDDKFLKVLGCRNVYTHSDTLHLGHLLNEMRSNGLKSHAFMYTKFGGYDYALEQYKDKFKPASYLEIPMLPNYAAQDAIHTFNIEAEMQKQLSELDVKFPPPQKGWHTMRSLYEDIIIPYINIFTDIELGGIRIDMEKWESGSKLLYHDIIAIKEELRTKLNLKDNSLFNALGEGLLDGGSKDVDTDYHTNKDELQSTKQLGELLERLGWPNLGRTKQGWYKTGDEQLARWAQLGYTQAELLQKLRSYLTMQKTFFGVPEDSSTGWKKTVVHHSDNDIRIHPQYGVMLTDTFRNNCKNPNFQQLPSNSKNLGEHIESFKRIIDVPDNSKLLIGLDFAGMQLRLATIDSQDPVLMKAYKENPNADIHSKTAFNIFARSQEFSIEEVLISDNNHSIMKFGHEEVTVMRSGIKTKIKARDILETDELAV